MVFYTTDRELDENLGYGLDSFAGLSEGFFAEGFEKPEREKNKDFKKAIPESVSEQLHRGSKVYLSVDQLLELYPQKKLMTKIFRNGFELMTPEEKSGELGSALELVKLMLEERSRKFGSRGLSAKHVASIKEGHQRSKLENLKRDIKTMDELVLKKSITNANQLAIALNEEGVPPPRKNSTKWFASTVLRKLKNAEEEGLLTREKFFFQEEYRLDEVYV